MVNFTFESLNRNKYPYRKERVHLNFYFLNFLNYNFLNLFIFYVIDDWDVEKFVTVETLGPLAQNLRFDSQV